MFNTYKKYENIELLRKLEIQIINKQLATGFIIPNKDILTARIQCSVESNCCNTENVLALNNKEDIGHLFGEFTYEYYDTADVTITEVPLEELQRQILKHKLLSYKWDYINTPNEGVYISENENILAFKKSEPTNSNYENIKLEIKTSDLQLFGFNGRAHHFVELNYININKIKLNSGYTVEGEKEVKEFIVKQVNYYNILKSKQSLLIAKIYKDYFLKDTLACLRARNSDMSDTDIINYSNQLDLSPKQLQKEITQLIKILKLKVIE